MTNLIAYELKQFELMEKEIRLTENLIDTASKTLEEARQEQRKRLGRIEILRLEDAVNYPGLIEV